MKFDIVSRDRAPKGLTFIRHYFCIIPLKIDSTIYWLESVDVLMRVEHGKSIAEDDECRIIRLATEEDIKMFPNYKNLKKTYKFTF